MADLLPARAVDSVLDRAIRLRHELHSAPETALEEHETRRRLIEFLGEGFRRREALMETDLIVEWPGEDDAACVALRADMDGLALDEETGCAWASRTPGRMHACGHDGHMAVLAAAALMLKESGIRPPRTVRFVFQPGEEVVGAGRVMAARGAYDGAAAAFALHGWPGIPVGAVALKEGLYYGASHNFIASFMGRGGHGAYPEKAANPLPAASRALLGLDALDASLERADGEVVSACALQGGFAANVIPEEARLMGTVRYRRSERGAFLEGEVRRILDDAAGKGVSMTLDYDRAYEVPLVNHVPGCAAVRRAAGKDIPVVGETGIERGSEDFAYALDVVPGALFKLGIGDTAPLHSPRFDFPDAALETGIAMMARLAMTGGEA